MSDKKYLIRKTNLRTWRIEYKRYKCSDGFNPNKDLCWKFSKQGALNAAGANHAPPVQSPEKCRWRGRKTHSSE